MHQFPIRWRRRAADRIVRVAHADAFAPDAVVRASFNNPAGSSTRARSLRVSHCPRVEQLGDAVQVLDETLADDLGLDAGHGARAVGTSY